MSFPKRYMGMPIFMYPKNFHSITTPYVFVEYTVLRYIMKKKNKIKMEGL